MIRRVVVFPGSMLRKSNAHKLLRLIAVLAILVAVATPAQAGRRRRSKRDLHCAIRIAYVPVPRQEVGLGSETIAPRSTFYFEPSDNPLASERPILVMIPGGPGLSHRTMEPLHLLSTEFNLLFVDPPGAGIHSKQHVYDRVENNRFELYEAFIKQFAQQLKEVSGQLGGRPLVLMGHSYGGVFATDVASRFGRELNLVGVVPISSYLTHAAYSQTEAIRKATRLGDASYMGKQNIVMDFDRDVERLGLSGVVEEYSRMAQVSPANRSLKVVAKSLDRSNLIDWAQAYGDLIWNEHDEQHVRALLESDRDSCSPEVVRFLLKPWRPDSSAGNKMVRELAAQTHIIKLIIAGSEDRLLPLETQLLTAEQMNADALVLEGASHFAFTTHLEAIRSELVRKFGLRPPR